MESDHHHSLLLNEAEFDQLPDINKKSIFVLEWLRQLDRSLNEVPKAEIKENQKKLMEQLLKQIVNNPGTPTRHLIGKCMATLFSVGDTFLLFEAVNKCNDILKNKDDSPSFLPTKLAATVCIGAMYEKLGRLMGRSYEETANLLLKSLKNSESQSRCEIYLTLERVVAGMGAAANVLHRDIFKAIRHGMVDRVMAVRCNAASCLKEMLKNAVFLYTTELENVFSLCFRSLEGSTYEVRCAVSDVLGYLVSITQKPNHQIVGKNVKNASLDEVLNLLALGFIKGGIGFLKGGPGDMIKGGSIVSRETRAGVTHAYVVAIDYLGNHWFEKNMSKYLWHLLELLARPKSASTHLDAVYCRRCVGYSLRSILGRRLGEKAQIQAIKELVFIVNKYINPTISSSSANENNSNSSTGNSKDTTNNDIQQLQHVLSCVLLEIGCILQELGTCSSSLLSDSTVSLVDNVALLLANSSPTVRISAAWCVKSIAIACPSQLTPLIERSLERLETLKVSPEITYGHSFALSALLSAANQTPLGLPQNKGKLIFTIAEDLLRTASQNSRLSLQRTQSGWQLIGGVLTLGCSVVRGLLPRLLLLWKNSFPRASKDLESEKARGDAFTWHITLENRAGALAAMTSFLTHCSKIVDEEVIRRLLAPIESALSMLNNMNSTFRNYGPSVKASSAATRLRLYETLLLMPAESFESLYPNLLRILVAEFTLADSAANTSTSLLRSLCQPDDGIILSSWIQDTDHRFIEDQVQPPSTSGSGGIEHDITTLYSKLDPDSFIPSPLPLGNALVNRSCSLFAHIFRFVANKHRIQMLTHFQECIKHEKASRQEAVQLNILAALLGSLKSLSENKVDLSSEEIKKILSSMLLNMLSHNNPVIRCAAAQALGRCGQVIGGAKFVAEIAQVCFDKLKTARDALSRTGHSLALGCLHRYVGSLGSNQNLNTSISILLVLSQDSASPFVQVWSLQALTLIADSGGPMFRPYIEPALTQSLKLLIEVPFYHCDVHQCIGKLLSAIITTVGPELQSDSPSIATTRSLLLVACGIMQNHRDSLVQSEAIGCLQQLHMFASKYVNLSYLVPNLCSTLTSPNLFLRRAAISYLHQLTQREAKIVCDFASSWLREMRNLDSKLYPRFNFQTDHGLPGIAFYILDHESDEKITMDAKRIITSLVQSTTTKTLHSLLSLCKEVLCSTDPSSGPSSPEKEFDGENDFDDDQSRFKARDETSQNPVAPPKWYTRVFATETLCRIIQACEACRDSQLHFDFALARQRKMKNDDEDFLVLHLSDLIRMAFMAATSESDQLRLEGLKALQLIIDKFSKVPEPEFPQHVILEQYQAQVGAALRPAFSPETPSHVTAMACQVCSAWIGSGVARDLNDLRRVHQLLVSSMTKLEKDSSSRLYNESAATLEKLAILKAWAEVYIVAMETEEEKERLKSLRKNHLPTEDEEVEEYETYNESLLHLVKPGLPSLSTYWLMSLRDHALLTLPPDLSGLLPHDGGAFFTFDTIEVARTIYRNSWPPILHAAGLWLCTSRESDIDEERNKTMSEYFPLLFGICMEALCNPKSSEPVIFIIICLKSLDTLLSHQFAQDMIGSDVRLSIELTNVLHRLLLTRDHPICQNFILKIAHRILNSRRTDLESAKQRKLESLGQSVDDGSVNIHKIIAELGEGGSEGMINTWESVVYSLLGVCLCVLVRHVPDLCSNVANTPNLNMFTQNKKVLGEEDSQIVGSCSKLLTELLDLCSPRGSVIVLPTVLFLVTGVLKEVAMKNSQCTLEKEPLSSILKCFENLGSSSLSRNPLCSSEWVELLQSCLAAILDLCKTSTVETRLDEALSVRMIGIFIIHMPLRVLSAPNLRYPCINLLTQALQSPDELAQLACLETIHSIFTTSDDDLKVPYIQALAPKMIESLGRMVSEISTSTSLSAAKFKIITQALANFEILTSLAKPEKRLNILVLYIPVLVSFLLESGHQVRRSSLRYSLHDYALVKLTSIGPNYPQEFKKIIASSPDFRAKLEDAVRNQQNKQSDMMDDPYRSQTKSNSATIELKTDFSNYKAE
ncbi:HEAT repeat-containing protein 5B isoform X2 [Brevipalpus obovatus]|uniref:HEAT repeat-containing protein 5B isoform X2 n=1 Tax=Brevipalpus obovatus TaxID=246614 RepID=UPI003D9F924C